MYIGKERSVIDMIDNFWVGQQRAVCSLCGLISCQISPSDHHMINKSTIFDPLAYYISIEYPFKMSFIILYSLYRKCLPVKKGYLSAKIIINCH